MKKITAKQFRKEFDWACQSYEFDYTLLGDYEHSHTKLRLLCPRHGEFSKARSSLIAGVGCPNCSKQTSLDVAYKKRISVYASKLSAISPKIKVSRKFDENLRLRHKCYGCNTIWRAHPRTMLSGKGCPTCNNWTVPASKLTAAEYKEVLKEKEFLLLETFTYSRKLKHQCLVCNTESLLTVTHVKNSPTPCPCCAKQVRREKVMLDKATWEKRIAEKHGSTVRMLGQYRGVNPNTRYRFKCYVCFNTWKAQLPSVGLSGTGCPHCNNQKKAKCGKVRVKTYKIDGVELRVQGWEFQAFVWLVENKGLRAEDILTESTSKVPVFKYKFGRRNRNYYPDMFIPKLNRIVEVKSNYTLGLNGGRREARNWKQNQAKAKAVLAEGYKFTLLLMDAKGTRYRLPANWYDLSAKEVLTWIAFHNGEARPKNVPYVKESLTKQSQQKLKQQVEDESRDFKARQKEDKANPKRRRTRRPSKRNRR